MVSQAVADSPRLDADERIGDLRQTVYYLASEELEGRGVGTEGLDLAAEYIASVFSRLQLEPPPGYDDYFQPFEMTTATRIGEETALRMDGESMELAEDYTPTSFSAEKAFAGGVVFAGYGITSEEHAYDDYAGIDVRDRVVLVMRFEPRDEQGRSRFADADWSQEATILRKARTAARNGAAALLLVNPPAEDDDVLMVFGSRFRDLAADIPVIHITRSLAGRLLRAGGTETLETLQRRIDAAAEPASVALDGVQVEGNVALSRARQTVRNVMAVLPGQGPNAGEFIVIGAHYDHLGRGGIGSLAPRSREVHPGADDNASGVAAMLTAAELLRQVALFESSLLPGLDRSILFVGFTAEEWGLIGSQHFVNDPPVPVERIAAMINLDMVGRVRGGVLYVGGAGTADVFDSILEGAGERSGLLLRPMGRGGFAASDHVSFTMRRIPALFFFSGLHADYHRPSDTADRINYEDLERVAVLTADVAAQLSAAERPRFVETGLGAMVRGLAGRLGQATLGVMPDYADEAAQDGMRITGVIPGSAAERAGVRAGDVLLQFGQRRITSVHDLTEALSASRPGDQVRLRMRRGGEELELEATLGRRGE